MNRPKTIYVHCAATPEGVHFDRQDIDRWHRDRGWSSIGYHAVVLLDGTIEIGRDPDGDGDAEEHIGAHVYGHNRNSLGIVYIGGVDALGRPKDTRTKEQRLALIEKVSEWMDRFSIPLPRVLGHYEADPGKACPSFDMGTFRSDLQAYRRRPLSASQPDHSRTKHPPQTSICTEYTFQINAPSAEDQCVERLQRALNRFLERSGSLLDPIVEDGFFGHQTKTRVAWFQRLNPGLAVDGIVGEKTWAALEPYL